MNRFSIPSMMAFAFVLPSTGCGLANTKNPAVNLIYPRSPVDASPTPRLTTADGSVTQGSSEQMSKNVPSAQNASEQISTGDTPKATAPVSIPVKVRGLVGTLVLQNNSGNELAIKANGDFEFLQPVAAGGSESDSVKTHP